MGYETPATTVDHIIPRHMGGGSEDENLQPLCDICHDAKTAKEKNGRLDRSRPVALDGSKHGSGSTIEPRKTGNSPRSKFIHGGRR
jgi:HNH endonuclease